MKFTALMATAAILATPTAFAECASKTGYQQVSTPVTYEAVLTMHQEEKADIVDTAAEAGSFGTLLAAAEAAGLVDALKGEGPLTVFAPTDEAFAALPEGTVETLLLPENKDALAGILMLHVISGKVVSGDLAGTTTEAETLNGTLSIDGTDGVTITAPGSSATVVSADVMASNGVIHVIDSVLLPAS